MSRQLRFPDLVAQGIVKSRPTLKRLVDEQGFPPGRLITPNARAWDEAEVDAWLVNRPIARKATTYEGPVKGVPIVPV